MRALGEERPILTVGERHDEMASKVDGYTSLNVSASPLLLFECRSSNKMAPVLHRPAVAGILTDLEKPRQYLSYQAG